MTDAQFTKLLQRCAKAKNKALKLLKESEEEYERRYNANPSDVDDDIWIDSMHGVAGFCQEDITADDVERGAVEYAKLKPYITEK